MKCGKEESVALLFEQYGAKIYSVAFRMCGNKEDAEDIVQKTFIQAIKGIGGFKEQSSIYTWIYSIAKNLCLKHLAERRKSSFSVLEELQTAAKLTENTDAFSVLEKQYYINQVKEGCLLGLLRCLSFYQRITFILNVLLEVNIRDVAAVIDKSETASRILVHRAKYNIKNFLCRNCSLYDANNPCRCENLIHFSLQQGWIKEPGNEKIEQESHTVEDIEHEIKGLKKVIYLYNSLEESPIDRLSSIQKEIEAKSYKIFAHKKVK